MPVRIVAVEALGAETLLVMAVDASNEELIARIGRDTALRSGDRLEVFPGYRRHPFVRSSHHQCHRLGGSGKKPDLGS